MRVRLIVKGDHLDATKAAHDHGLSFKIEQAVGSSTVGLTEAPSAVVLAVWFGEHREAPYPDGALLLWTPMRESE